MHFIFKKKISSNTDWLAFGRKIVKPVLNIALFLLFFIIAIRPFKKWLNKTGEYVSTRALPPGENEDGTEAPTAELEMRQKNKQKLIQATKDNPEVAADIIKTWINEVS